MLCAGLGLAVGALVARRRVLLLDEALSALDEPLRDRLRLELQTLSRELGLTVAHVTHDREEALALADRVVMLDGGRIQQIGSPAELVVLPSDVRIDPSAGGDAVVRSSLFGRDGNDVVVDWAGLSLRVRTSRYRPVVGERVTVTVERALVFPTEGVRDARKALV